MTKDCHIVVTDLEDFGLSAESPQIPGLVGVWKDNDEFHADLPAIAQLAPDGSARLVLHEQKVQVAPNGDEYLVRYAVDHRHELRNTVGRVLLAIQEGRITEEAHQQPQLATGERLLVAALPSDKLGFIFDQMVPGYGLTVQCNPHEADMTWSIFIRDGIEQDGFLNVGLRDLGLSRDSTVQEALSILPTLEMAGDDSLIHI